MRMVIREEFQPHRANCKNISEGRVFSLKDNGKTLPLKSKSLPLKSKSLPLRTHEHRNLWNSSLKKKNFIQENIRTRHLKTNIKSEYLRLITQGRKYWNSSPVNESIIWNMWEHTILYPVKRAFSVTPITIKSWLIGYLSIKFSAPAAAFQ